MSSDLGFSGIVGCCDRLSGSSGGSRVPFGCCHNNRRLLREDGGLDRAGGSGN